MMKIDHIHFYVENATNTSNWLIEKMGFRMVNNLINNHTYTKILSYNNIFFLISSPTNNKSRVFKYLNNFASGVADIAFQVKNIDFILKKISNLENHILDHSHTYLLPEGKVKTAKIKGFNSLQHTLIENNTNFPFYSLLPYLKTSLNTNLTHINFNINHNFKLSNNNNYIINSIDHVVLNVNKSKLTKAVKFYQKVFGFKTWQKFKIKTNKSGLSSRALIAPNNNFYFNINEPTSDNSQIQEFIDFNGGSGIQHIALRSHNIINIVSQMRSNGLKFLPMSNSYYTRLKKHGRYGIVPNLTALEWKEIEKQQILVDFHPTKSESLLMQIFTKPIFNQPTFFFEIIERRKKAQGFGEGNFQALFELIETEQIKRNKRS